MELKPHLAPIFMREVEEISEVYMSKKIKSKLN